MAFFQNAFVEVARGYYSPELGRFISPDTVLDGLNRYAYCGNNPINYTDPTGNTIIYVGSPGGWTYSYDDGKGNGEGSHNNAGEGNKGDANKSTGSGDTTSPGGKSDPTDGSGVTGNDPQQPPPGQNAPNNDTGKQNRNDPDPRTIGNTEPHGPGDLRNAVQEIAWDNPSSPSTDPNSNGYWSCGTVFIDTFDYWGIPIQPLQIANGLSGVAAIHQNLLNATDNGKHQGLLSNSRHLLKITPLRALAAQQAANNVIRGQSIVVSTRAEHVQICVAKTTNDHLTVAKIMDYGPLVVQGGLAPYSCLNQQFYYNGNLFTLSYTMGPTKESQYTTSQAMAGPWEGSPTYFLIQVIF